MYAEVQPQGAKSQTPIFGAPGLVNFATCGLGPVRALWVMGGVMYAVSGGTLYSISSTGSVTSLGSSVPGTNVLSISDNGTQLCVTNGTNGFIYTTAAGFQLIVSANFFASKTVTFFDNYFVFDKAGTNQFFISNSLDGTTYSALDFATAAVSPDYVVATANQQENLLIFGQKTIETWYDSGDVNFPFNRYDGATIERGCSAALSILKEDNSVFFLGDDKIYYRLNGVIPVRISTHAIEYAWSQYLTISDAFAFSYTWNGHKFIALTFPSANATWVYDISTNLWHERVSYDSSNRSLSRWRGNCHVSCYNREFIGDAFSGSIGYLDDSTYTEFGNPIEASMTGPVIHSDRKRVFIDEFELDIETGVGLASGQGSDPQVMLQWSKDGGRTFSQQQIWNSMGALGAYQKRLRWTRMGNARAWVIRATISDPVKRVVIANNARIRVGTR